MKKIIVGLLVMVGLVCLVSVKAYTDVVGDLSPAYHAGNFAEVEKICRAALQTNLNAGESAATQFYLANALERQGKYGDAVAEYAKTVALGDKYAEGDGAGYFALATLQKGICLNALKQFADAQVEFKKCIVYKNTGTSPANLQQALSLIKFSETTREEDDALLIKAYQTVTNKQAKDKDGNLIYTKYLDALVAHMSQKAQTNMVK